MWLLTRGKNSFNGDFAGVEGATPSTVACFTFVCSFVSSILDSMVSDLEALCRDTIFSYVYEFSSKRFNTVA